MPPNRRRPAPSTGQTPPIRRPKVAGLRNRPGQQAEDAAEQTMEQLAITDEEPAREEPERVSGVLDGVLGKAPAAPDADDRAEPDESEEDPAAKEPRPDTDTDAATEAEDEAEDDEDEA
ncbi:MAG: hypothetical protein WBA97_09705, partial [Actinophytocola sp.]